MAVALVSATGRLNIQIGWRASVEFILATATGSIPVCAAAAYGSSEQVLAVEQNKLNPIKRADVLADARVLAFIIRDRDDQVVPWGSSN